MIGKIRLQTAIPPIRYAPENRRNATCRCGERIVTSCFGWVHRSNAWIRTSRCEKANPV
jgi:hypothetical protein